MSSSPELEIASGQKRQSGPARRRAKAQGAASGSQRACSRRALVLVADDGTCRWRDALASPDGAALLALLQQKRQEAALEPLGALGAADAEARQGGAILAHGALAVRAYCLNEARLAEHCAAADDQAIARELARLVLHRDARSLRYAQAPLTLPTVASAACASAVALERPDSLAGPLAGHPAAQNAVVSAFQRWASGQRTPVFPQVRRWPSLQAESEAKLEGLLARWRKAFGVPKQQGSATLRQGARCSTPPTRARGMDPLSRGRPALSHCLPVAAVVRVSAVAQRAWESQWEHCGNRA